MSYTKKTLALLSLLVLGIIALYVVGFILLGRLHAKTAELNRKTIEEEKMSGQEMSLKMLAKDIKPNLDTLSQFVIPKEGDIDFIKTLETLGTEQSVSLQIVSAAEIDQDPFKQITFNVVVAGPWSRVVHTVDLIESLPYKVHVGEVNFNQVSTTEQQASSTVTSKSWRAALKFTVIKEK